MKPFFFTLAVIGILCSQVYAFPAIALEAATKRAGPHVKEKRQNPGFDASAQLIDVTGAHAFVPPDFTAGDLRGPCPGLNALANHNYLPHDGFASVTQFVEATNQGMQNRPLYRAERPLLMLRQSLEWASILPQSWLPTV